MLYLWVKVLHVVSATVLFGTELGIAFFKMTADGSGNVKAMRVVGDRASGRDRCCSGEGRRISAV